MTGTIWGWRISGGRPCPPPARRYPSRYDMQRRHFHVVGARSAKVDGAHQHRACVLEERAGRAATVINTAVIPACHISGTRLRRPRLAGREDVLSWAPISLVVCPHRARCDAQRQCVCVTGAGHAPMDEAHRRRACVTDLEVRSRHHCDQRGREPCMSYHTDTLPPPVVSRSGTHSPWAPAQPPWGPLWGRGECGA